MDDPLVVGSRNRVRHRHCDVDGALDGPAFGWNRRRQWLPVHELHGQEVNAAALLH